MKKVVIVGGGFAGSYSAKKLEKEFDVILIDTKSFFEFTPGVLRTIVNPEHARKIQIHHKDYLRNARIIVGEVKEAGKNFVKVNGKKVKFDYLIVASGSRYKVPIKEQNVILATRVSRLRDYYERLHKADSVVIVGGGIVGVELAAEIALHYRNKKLTLVHLDRELMPRNSKRTRKYAEKFLKKRGVEIIFNDRVEKVKGKKCFTKNGLKLDADLVFMCTGIKPNYEFMKKNFSKDIDNPGVLRVNKYLQLDGYKNIFVAGDVAEIKEEKTAQNAEIHAKLIVKNIKRIDDGRELKEYKIGKRIMVMSLGRWNGIIEYGDFIITGICAGILKSLIEMREMWRRRWL